MLARKINCVYKLGMKKAPEQIKEWAKAEGRKLGWLASQIPAGQSDLSRWVNSKAIPIRIYRVRMSEITGLELCDESCWKVDHQ